MSGPRRKSLYDLADVIIDNAALILTIGFAGFVIYRQDIAGASVSTEELLTAILWVMGLFAVSEIVERYRKWRSIHISLGMSLHRFSISRSSVT